jgi:Spy/CpxP family protein refolding chaperone
MKSKYFKILAIALAVAVIAAVAVSQTVRRAHRYGGGMFGGPMVGFLVHKLDLTDAQQAQVKAIMAKEKPAVQPLVQQMFQGHAHLRQLAMSGAFDEARARELASQQAQTMTELTVQRARIDSELYQVLTTEQKAKLNDLINQHEQRFMERMQRQNQEQSQ